MRCKIFFIFTVIFLFFLQNVGAVWINQVYYDPIGSETYGEAVELFNPSDKSVNLEGWILWTTSSEKDVIIPKNMFIDPYGYFLIADEKWNESKDDVEWRNADLEEKMTLKNSNGGVALVDAEGNVVDVVGWGNEEDINDDLFEGVPAKKVKSGESLLRIHDTGDNSEDFISAKPYFFTTGEMIIQTDVGQEGADSSDFQIKEDDSSAEGIQIQPIKGGSRYISVKGHSSDLLFFAGKQYNFTKTNNSYEAVLEISYNLVPGIYTLMSGDDKVDIEILPVRGLTVIQRILNINVIPGSFETKKVKLKNTGNTELKVYAKCQKLSSQYVELKGKMLVFKQELSEEWQELTVLQCGEEKEVDVSISVLDDAEKGEYKAILSFKGE